MSTSPFPYTCELCGAEGLTDEGMRSHTLEAHVAGRPECPFCDCAVPPPQLVGHVQRAHLHYLTPERELMAFIDDQSPRCVLSRSLCSVAQLLEDHTLRRWLRQRFRVH